MNILKSRWLLCGAMLLAHPVFSLDGEVGVHDPSTIVSFDGRYYTFGSGKGLPGLVSDDGWSWKRAQPLMSAMTGGQPGPEVLALGANNTWAPDIIKVRDKFFVYYSAPGTQPRSAIGLLVGSTLDPSSPDYRWEDAGPVVWSDGEDNNAIDPGVLLDPTSGRLWMTYGSYFGSIRLVELDPRNGKRRNAKRVPLNIAINAEASVPIYYDGWYYLMVTHGSCCAGANSTYNIRMGRARRISGPYLDNMGVDMREGGGKLFADSRGRHIGPGHFGMLDLGAGVQKFSLHYEADLDRGGISVLDIRPLLWRDGWPVAGENLEAGTFSVQSARTGTVLELAVQGMPVGGLRPRPDQQLQPGPPIAVQEPADVASNWPAAVGVRLAPAMLQAQQKWTIAPVADAGGYPGAPYFRITLAGTERSLTATSKGELTTATFNGAAEQLWRIDQLVDGTYRILAKAVPLTIDTLALSAVGSSTPTLAKFDLKSNRQRWVLRAP